MIKIVFLGTPDFAVESLRKLNEDKNISVDLVISQKDKKRSRGKFTPTPVKQYAIENNLECITPENINSDEVYETLKELNPDLLVVVAYGQIIGDRLLTRFKDRIINLHSSVLPKYRGAAPINWAIIEGEKETGTTIMLVEKELDSGDILKIENTPIDENENAEQLHDRLKIIGAKSLVEVVNNFDYYYNNRVKQNEKIAVYRGMLKKSMGKINWADNIKDLYNKFRGMYPWPGFYFNYDNKIVKIHEMNIIKENHDNEFGKVVKVADEGIKIAVNGGYVVLNKIQFPNKKAMYVKDFLKGNEFKTNIILEG
ncbi:methionyl-tRNA formyltransferase [Miniphocaeibacter halophilus]|uniref:Methionyl-tRNA formyltransferase n=1 Tax=Miniphocaeibacter halophilus TaxID=2931922 RepID=A0AC61MQ78_9FIRM|nr:methionyl-tRNA formyltransferase [Miniphocaeibacter halophilus]QQK07761.1 methionyl-tRNA formyltransferase [Miniphocaeibacter halophilus]